MATTDPRGSNQAFVRNAQAVIKRVAVRGSADEVDPKAIAALALAGPARSMPPVLVGQADRAPAGPTRTKTIQDDYSAAAYRRFRRIKGLIRTTVATNDALRLGDDDRGDRGPGRVQEDDPVGAAIATNAEPVRDFEFVADPEKADAFLDWLQQAEDDEILEVFQRSNGRVVSRDEWQNVYVRRAYARGVEWAEARLREQDIPVPDQALASVFNTPLHADALGILYTRNFRELEGITEAMDQEISRVLTDGFSQGYNPRKMARELNDRVDKVGITRARVLARTETINAHSTSTLNRFEEIAGDDTEVTVKAEWSTAGDSRVCQICQGLEGEVFKLDEARGILPIHPNCRCAYIPIVQNQQMEQMAKTVIKALKSCGCV